MLCWTCCYLRLTRLSIRFCHLDDRAVRRIAYDLGNIAATNTSLLSLDLSHNDITDLGVDYLCKVTDWHATIRHYCTLSCLVCRHCGRIAHCCISRWPTIASEMPLAPTYRRLACIHIITEVSTCCILTTQVITEMKLTHPEVIKRRALLSEKLAAERMQALLVSEIYFLFLLFFVILLRCCSTSVSYCFNPK